MKRPQRDHRNRPGTSLLCIALLLLPLASAAAQADESLPQGGYYDQRLREGSRALELGDADRAVAELRLACFGFLSSPNDLTPCLAKLALAQSTASSPTELSQTVDRLESLEDRFQTLSQGALSEELHARLRDVLVARTETLRLPATSLLLAEALPEPKIEPEPMPETTSESVPSLPETKTAATLGTDPNPSQASPSSQASPLVGPMAGDLPSLAVATLERARKLYESAARISELEEALSLARTVADEHADSGFAQQLTAEIAFRASRFATALRYFERGMPLPPLRSDLRFYRAVSLYEVGLADAAKRALQECVNEVEPSPWVEEIKSRILDGPQA